MGVIIFLGEKYCYDKVFPCKKSLKVIITCNTHGDFLQNPREHLKGHGCRKCADANLNLTTEEFIKKSNKVHAFRYDYSKAVYKDSNHKISIICKTHGIFKQQAGAHARGQGCPECAKETLRRLWASSTEEFIEKSKKVHLSGYTYDKVRYVNNVTPVIITCSIHGDYMQSPNKHLLGHGCKKCANTKVLGGTNFVNIERKKEYFMNIAGSLYITKCFKYEESFYKIGITKETISARFKKIPYNYDVIYMHTSSVYNSFYIEQHFHSLLKGNQYTPKIKFCGYTECFSELLLTLDEIKVIIKQVETSIENNTHRDSLLKEDHKMK